MQGMPSITPETTTFLSYMNSTTLDTCASTYQDFIIPSGT